MNTIIFIVVLFIGLKSLSNFLIYITFIHSEIYFVLTRQESIIESWDYYERIKATFV